MGHFDDERECLDEQEALARAGIERAVRALGVDLIEALSLPKHLRDHEMFEVATAVASGAISHDATLAAMADSFLGKNSQPINLRGILRRACLDSVLAIATAEYRIN